MNSATLRFRIQVSRRFIATLLAAWFLTAGALVFGNPSGPALGVFLAAVACLGQHSPRRSGMQVDQKMPDLRPREEEAFPIELGIRNVGRRTLLTEWSITMPGLSNVTGRTAGIVVLHGRERFVTKMEAKFSMFGIQRVGPVQLRTEDAFGFVAAERWFDEAEVQVYPQRPELHDAVLRTKQKRSLMGRYEVAQRGDGFEFFGLRGYQAGDRPRDVNWKASARTGSLIVNQHQKENDAEVVILVDLRRESLVGLHRLSPFAQGCRAALAVAEAHLRTHDAVRFIGYGQGVQEDRHTGSTRHLQGILDLTLTFEASGSLPLAEVVNQILPSLKPRSPIILFSCLQGDQSVPETLALLRSHEFPLMVFVPRPQWGKATRPQTAAEWDATQEQAVQTIRRSGVPIAHANPAHGLDAAFLQLEVSH